MNQLVRAVASSTIFLLITATGFAAPPATAAGETLVIVFKDGHRQSLNLADVARMEFPGPVPAGLISVPGPSRARYYGKWEVGDGSGKNFFITLRDDDTAFRSLGDVRGKWEYVNGEAQVTWDDGAQDAIRKVGSVFRKFAYRQGRSFSDTPDNVTNARNLTQNPSGVD